ncbi:MULTISPECIES: energy-coupling factor transporter transmembrane protein EcfT [Rhodomicrobium]|uniref:energy-coupling factor transporter transmembrane component T family protein n=1 Tax=Rhodomicrobium TaxID=1068 RepID=UPI000B4A9AAE|nr:MULTISPECIES: energy-coupling factor transporter transmembrane protein EcfT [Rhodomicrobium]
MLALYIHRGSPIHRLGAGSKILVSIAGSFAIVLVKPLWLLAGILLAVASLYPVARLPLRAIARALKPVLLVTAALSALQLALAGPAEAASTALRILSLVLLTSLVTLTTRLSDMLDVLTRAARPLAALGLSPPKLALAVGLAIRFIPTLLQDLQEIQQARLARRARGPSLFGIGPLMVKILRMTDALGDAIAARGFDNRK